MIPIAVRSRMRVVNDKNKVQKVIVILYLAYYAPDFFLGWLAV